MNVIEDTKLNKLRVLVIGCGNIAGGFDEIKDPSQLPLTHAGAYLKDGRFEITACVEPNSTRRNEFMTAWSIPVGFNSIDELLMSQFEYNFDVISICSPTNCHSHNFDLAVKMKPKLIFCEKPVTFSLKETKKIVSECDKAGVLLAINYTRRWDPYIQNLQAEIKNGQKGELRSVSGIYNKGILNNGSHMLDLLSFLIGDLRIIKVGTPVVDYSSEDPSIPVWLETTKSIPIHISIGNANDYSIFELQLVFSDSILTMEEGGMFWSERHVVDSDTFRGYKKLGISSRSTGLYSEAMLCSVDNIYNAVNENSHIASTGVNAIVAQEFCNDIKQLSLRT